MLFFILTGIKYFTIWKCRSYTKITYDQRQFILYLWYDTYVYQQTQHKFCSILYVFFLLVVYCDSDYNHVNISSWSFKDENSFQTSSLLTQFTSCTVLQPIHYDKLIQNRPFYMLDTYSHEDNDIISFLPLFHSFPLSSVCHLYNFDLNMTLNVFRTYNNLYSSFDPLH